MDLDDDRYYREIDHMYKTYGPTRDHIPVNQAPGPCLTMQELIQAFGRGRGQARREELHGHQPNSMKDQENSTHVTEVCEHAIIIFYNNSICP